MLPDRRAGVMPVMQIELNYCTVQLDSRGFCLSMLA
jgi:hypothetical protein